LAPHTHLKVFEKCTETGGHTHTVDLPFKSSPIPVDTGFMVYNEATYPLLTQLFADLGVETVETDMSFSVNFVPEQIEFCGSSINQMFSSRKNALKHKFWKMLFDIVRFNKTALKHLNDVTLHDLNLSDFVKSHNFSKPFLDYYLLPMTSAIWSTPPSKMLDFPASTLIRFLYNHGLLGVATQHQWRTVVGGSRQYRDKLTAPFADKIRVNAPVRSVSIEGAKAVVRTEDNISHVFDKVVIATHADTALKLLERPSSLQTKLLSAFPYGSNQITLHTDKSVMPSHSRAWAAWNYRMDDVGDILPQASTHYWMNKLQNLTCPEQVFVSVNDPGHINRSEVIQEFVFDHPMFDKLSAILQPELPKLNKHDPILFCGAYFRYGFHEDGLMSGYSAANTLLDRISSNDLITV
jgi:predicted NAD/FAD-binding protein